jgi:hypothetical protein
MFATVSKPRVPDELVEPPLERERAADERDLFFVRGTPATVLRDWSVMTPV